MLSRISIPTEVKPYPSICLGTCDLSIFEMLWGYSIFAGRGFSTKPITISRIEDRNGVVIKRFDNTANRKEAISEVTAYTMCKMMQGTVDRGTARGLRTRVGAAEMGGKTGTTDDNADAWFIGYTPQLLAGSWVGFEYNFMRNTADGNTIARPITEYFFRKVLADGKLGYERDAKFIKPEEMENEINSADIFISETDPSPAGEGVDQGVGEASDYMYEDNGDTLGPESKEYEDDEAPAPKKDKPAKKDSLNKSVVFTDDRKQIHSKTINP